MLVKFEILHFQKNYSFLK